MPFWQFFYDFWCQVTFSSNLSNFEQNTKKKTRKFKEKNLNNFLKIIFLIKFFLEINKNN